MHISLPILIPGLVIMSGKLMKGTDIVKAEKAVNEVINELNGFSSDRL